MKITSALVLLLVAAAAIPFIALSAVIDDPNTDNPEFYFTRLRYREGTARNRGGFRGTMPKLPSTICTPWLHPDRR